MSVIIRHNDVIKMMIKGADKIIKDRLKKDVDQPYADYVDSQLTKFSIKGLRTLCLAMKILS